MTSWRVSRDFVCEFLTQDTRALSEATPRGSRGPRRPDHCRYPGVGSRPGYRHPRDQRPRHGNPEHAGRSDHGNCPARSQWQNDSNAIRPQQLQRSRRGRRHGKGCGELTGAIGGDHAFRRLSAEALGRPGLLARNQPRAHSLSWLVHAKLYLSEPTCDSRSQLSASHSQATQGGARDPKDTCMASSIWTSFNQVSVRLSNPDSALHRLSF